METTETTIRNASAITGPIPFFELTEKKALTAKALIFSGAPLLITEIDMNPYIEHINWLIKYQMIMVSDSEQK